MTDNETTNDLLEMVAAAVLTIAEIAHADWCGDGTEGIVTEMFDNNREYVNIERRRLMVERKEKALEEKEKKLEAGKGQV